VEVADDDDDLLKAAEELGMDLTGVRADGNGGTAADEQEEQVVKEGEGGTDGAKAEDAETEEAEAK
jgi:DNA-directed RNA polymerase subunit beta